MSNEKTAVYTLGENIRKAREDMGWKQSDLAVRVKKSRAAVATWESNKHRPSELELDKIAEVTGYPIEFFIDTDGGSSISKSITGREVGVNFARNTGSLDDTLLQLAA